MDVLYAICVDGPCAGFVCEVAETARDIQLTTDATHCYRRRPFHPAQVARIARFAYTGSLVI